MFNFSKKNTSIFSPADGRIKHIEEVKDEAFSSKVLGAGYAVEPSNGEVYAPLAGTIKTIFPTKHAIGIVTKQGVECLIHMGIDTVELEGKPFDILVSNGDKVNKQTKLATVDLLYLRDRGKDDDILVVFTNSNDKLESLEIDYKGKVTKSECIGQIKLKR